MAQLLRKHLFFGRAWKINLLPSKSFEFSTTGIVMMREWNAHKCLSSLNNRELLNRNRIIIVVEVLEFRHVAAN